MDSELGADDVLCLCYICQASPTDPVLTACCHLFCWECLFTALVTKQTGGCPVCKTHLHGGLTPLHGSHIQMDRPARDQVPFTVQCVLKTVDELEHTIGLSRMGLDSVMDGLRDGMESIQVYLHELQHESLQGRRLRMTEGVDVLMEKNEFCRQEEARIREHLQARNRLVLEIMELLRAVVASNHMLPCWKMDHVQEQATLIPFRTELLLCRVCTHPPVWEPVATSCGHLFCWACLHASFRGQDEIPCPVCGTGLKVERNVVPVYAAGGSSCSAGIPPAGNVGVVAPMPTWTPAAGVAGGVWHECVRSDPILTMAMVNYAVGLLNAVSVVNDEDRAFLDGGWERGVRGHVNVTILEWNFAVLNENRWWWENQQLRGMNLLGDFVLRLRILLAQPVQSFTTFLMNLSMIMSFVAV